MEHKRNHIDLSHQPLTEDVLMHISRCDSCAEEFADYIEANAYIRAPRDLSHSIIERSHHLDVQIVEKSNQASRRIQLLWYSLRVAAAVVAALIMLMAGPDLMQYGASRPFAAASLYERAEQWTGRLNQYQNSFNQPEVISYDKEEK